MALTMRSGRQSDGNNSLERLALRLRSGSENILYYKFQVNPSNYKEELTQRTTTYKTRSSSIVEDYGPDIRQIQFSGTTGFRRDGQGRTGAQRLALLKAMIEEYSLAGQRVEGQYRDNLELYFYNFTDGGSYIVHLAPEGLTINRSDDQPLLFNYQITLNVLRRASEPSERDRTTSISGSAGSGLSFGTGTNRGTGKQNNPNSNISSYRPAQEFFNKQMK